MRLDFTSIAFGKKVVTQALDGTKFYCGETNKDDSPYLEFILRVRQKQGRIPRFLQSERNILLSAKVLPARTLDPISRTELLRHPLFLIQTTRSPATHILQYLKGETAVLSREKLVA